MVLLIVLGVVYLYGLTSTGMLMPDEPRYAAIGRAMAQSGDWVTPKLWDHAWFEKPPALYWMIAVATKAGLGMETAPRLPVALLGLGFLVFFYLLIKREFGPAEALYATAVLGTSAGWMSYSFVAVTDVPMSVYFCAALLLSLEWVAGRSGSPARALVVGLLLGLAVLAKGLVPLVLFAPVVWPMRRRISHLFLIAGSCVLVAAPWYLECTFQNGMPFLTEFFWRHHFERFASDSLKHVRPFWFYIPVLLGAVFPWTPLVALVRPGIFQDPRLKFAGFWTLYALLFFSASRNKLPGYLIPLLPGVCLILGIALGWAKRTRVPLFLCALLLAAAPAIATLLPDALLVGLSRTSWRGFDVRWVFLFAVLAAGPLYLEIRSWRTQALALTALLTAGVFLYVKATTLPATDRVRPFYRESASRLEGACFQDVDRDARYILQYYSGREYPPCGAESRGPRVAKAGSRLILVQ